MSHMLHPQSEIPCGIYCTEQESEEIVANRIRTCIAERTATQQSQKAGPQYCAA